ncbi:MAG: hypothetical protein Tsb009_36340 [Planctomycetaceae bacterium]
MSLILPRSLFLHAPKTGGSWVRRALHKAGLAVREVGDFHGSQPLDGNRLVFTFVRNPADWYLSRWRCPHHQERFRMGQNDQFQDALTEQEARCFPVWLERILKITAERRGPADHLFSHYMRRADFVGRSEHLEEDLIEALHQAGEEFDEQAIRSTPRINESVITRQAYTEELFEEMLLMEQNLIESFGYQLNPNDYLHT